MSLLLSIEPEGFDSLIKSFVDENGFDHGGVDCVLEANQRDQVREGFSYYTGLPSSRVPRSSAQRRAFLILNGVTDSASHDPWELLYFSQSYGSGVKDEVLGLINSIMPGGGGNSGGLTYAAWLAEHGLPEDTPVSGDSDGDDVTNGVEFYIGTSPLNLDLQPLTIARVDETHVSVSYSLGQNREGVTAELEGSSDFINWTTEDVSDENRTITPGEALDSATITLPINGIQFLRLHVSVE